MPCCCTATPARHGPRREYARTLSGDPVEGFAFFEESIELSRRFRALKLWLSLRYHGVGQLRTAIGADLCDAQLLARLITAEPPWSCWRRSSSAWCASRFRDAPEGDLDRRNAAILGELARRGRVYLYSTRVRGAFALRACIISHRTTDADITAIAEEVLAAASAA